MLSGIVAGAYVLATKPPTNNMPSQAEMDAASARYQATKARQEAQQKIELKVAMNDFSYNIARIAFTVKNSNTFPVKDLTVTCKFLGASGTPISSRTETIFEVIKPSATKRTAALSYGFTSEQTKKFYCELSGFAFAM